MINDNLETRVSALEVQMQDIRDLLQQTVVIVNRTAQIAESNAQSVSRTAQIVSRTAQIAESNARSVQAWESRIEENRIEAEEERSQLAVRTTELEIASRENIQQHFAFMQRFDETLAEIRRIWQRIED